MGPLTASTTKAPRSPRTVGTKRTADVTGRGKGSAVLGDPGVLVVKAPHGRNEAAAIPLRRAVLSYLCSYAFIWGCV